MGTQQMYDAIIIGGGHNGLVSALVLARAGRRVLVLERRAQLGGAASTEELIPGFRFNTGAPNANLLPPDVFSLFRKHPPSFMQSEVMSFAPQLDESAVTIWRSTERTAMELATHSANDARSYWEYARQLERFAGVLAKMAQLRPPSLTENPARLLLAWARLALDLRRLGGRDMMDFMRVLPMGAATWLNEHFESDAIKGLYAAYATTGVMQGPRASGTAFMLLYQHMGGLQQRAVVGGVGAVSAGLAAEAQEHGTEIRTGSGVARILASNGRVHGVELENGEQLTSRQVLSNADPHTTYLKLLGPAQLEPRSYRRMRSLKLRGSTATVHFALSGAPQFLAAIGQPERLQGDIIISPSLDYAEQAYDDAKHGRLSAKPVLIARIPSLLDSTLAPARKHTLSVTVRYAPYALAESDWDAERERLGDLVMDTLAEYAPNLNTLVEQRHILTPLDYERDYGLAGGSEMHGQMGLDQLLLQRPISGSVGHRLGGHAPQGLYICGAGGHPGGGLTGLPGLLAAQQALAEQ
ncbi:MAG: NAD(P)/FAD-dependent oxidoreductase [Anaerolineales bacterium]|nr:NAD(P)/FAD-dependent oxidoreductase [Anaerolineales bacterium]